MFGRWPVRGLKRHHAARVEVIAGLARLGGMSQLQCFASIGEALDSCSQLRSEKLNHSQVKLGLVLVRYIMSV